MTRLEGGKSRRVCSLPFAQICAQLLLLSCVSLGPTYLRSIAATRHERESGFEWYPCLTIAAGLSFFCRCCAAPAGSGLSEDKSALLGSLSISSPTCTHCYERAAGVPTAVGAGLGRFDAAAASVGGAFRFRGLGVALPPPPAPEPGGRAPKPSRLRVDMGNLVRHVEQTGKGEQKIERQTEQT